MLVVIEGDGKFEVLHSRAKSTATGAVFLGLTGYGIEESGRVGEDNKREEQVLAFLPDDDCSSSFETALLTRLEEKDYSATVVASEKDASGSFDRTIRLKIRACGFKLSNSTSGEVTAFYAASYAVARDGGPVNYRPFQIQLAGLGCGAGARRQRIRYRT